MPWRPEAGVVRLLLVLIALGGCSGATSNSEADGGVDGGAIAGLTLAELSKACVITAACKVKQQPRVSDCVDYYDVLRGQGLGPAYDRRYRCVLAAKADCAKVRACFGQLGNCAKGTYQAECRSNKAYSCDLLDQTVYELDCGLGGLACRIDRRNTFSARCLCDASFQPRCHGSWAITCVDGAPRGIDCAVRRQSCSDGRCAAPASGASCDASTFKGRCDGSVAVACHDGREVESDCARQMVNNRCSGGRCVASDTRCSDDFNRCKDGDLEACVDGRWVRFDCASLGLGDCRTASFGANCAIYN